MSIFGRLTQHAPTRWRGPVLRHVGLMLILISGSAGAYAAKEDDALPLPDEQATGWQLVKTDKLHGITAYYKREDGKRYRSFRVEANYDNSFDASACHLLDIDNYPRWFMNVAESRVLKRVTDTEFFMYMKIKAPLGVPARDIPLHVVIQPYSIKTGAAVISYRAAPDFLPVVPGVIRMPAYEVTVRLGPLENGKSFDETTGYAEPGGPVPVWLVNYFQRQMPYASAMGRWRDIARYEDRKLPCPFRYKEKE